MPLRRNRPASRVYVDVLDPEEEEPMEAALGRWIIVVVDQVSTVRDDGMVSTVNLIIRRYKR